MPRFKGASHNYNLCLMALPKTISNRLVRQYSYYVFPVLEGDKFAGRIELKANRQSKSPHILDYWPEVLQKMSKARKERIMAELTRILALSDCNKLENTQILN